MASLASLLPKPKNVGTTTSNERKPPVQNKQQNQIAVNATTASVIIPSYGQRYSGWIPKKEEDFGDGGAFPEVHVAQFPIGMGRKDRAQRATSSQNSLALVVDANSGTAISNAVLSTNSQIARLGQRKDKIVYSQYTDLIEHQIDNEDALMKPSEDSIKQSTEETRDALQKLINGKIGAIHNSHSGQKLNDEEDQPTYFRYTSTNSENNESRIVKVNEAMVDPMEPAKFHMKKIPRGPPSPPPPVMHSPDKKLSKEEREAWALPACISNWKNPKGYTIALHQRLAADGRDLQEVQMNNKFAKFSESLLVAETEIRKDIDERAELQKKLLIKQKEAREKRLIMIAQRARHARYGGTFNEGDDDGPQARRAPESDSSDSESDQEMDREEMKRNQLREERAKEHRYDKRRHKRKGANSMEEEDREISEKIALGQAAQTTGEDDIDSRLTTFASGLDSGFGTDDSYNIYDRPFMKGSSANQMYKPSKEAMESYGVNDLETDMESSEGRFTKSFRGRETEIPSMNRSGPVQFEREPERERARPSSTQEEKDPFGWDKFMTDTRESRKRPLEHIGKSGFMKATGGSSSLDSEDYRSSKRKRIDFQSGSNK